MNCWKSNYDVVTEFTTVIQLHYIGIKKYSNYSSELHMNRLGTDTSHVIQGCDWLQLPQKTKFFWRVVGTIDQWERS